jgi:hypothetical protein
MINEHIISTSKRDVRKREIKRVKKAFAERLVANGFGKNCTHKCRVWVLNEYCFSPMFSAEDTYTIVPRDGSGPLYVFTKDYIAMTHYGCVQIHYSRKSNKEFRKFDDHWNKAKHVDITFNFYYNGYHFTAMLINKDYKSLLKFARQVSRSAHEAIFDD